MDYTVGGRIYLDEFEDEIVISNPGSFIPGDVRNVLKAGYRAPYYRNQLLSDAMKELNMIDTVQMGISRIFSIQRDRYFPLPDYDLQLVNEVSVKVYGKILDENYTRLIFGNRDIDLNTVFLLDRVQKKLPLDKAQYKILREKHMIRGSVPNVQITVQVNARGDEQTQDDDKKIEMKNEYYMDIVVNFLEQYGSGTKADFIKLLSGLLPDVLDDKQKDNKIRTLLAAMHSNGVIERTTQNKRSGVWRLAEKEKK